MISLKNYYLGSLIDLLPRMSRKINCHSRDFRTHSRVYELSDVSGLARFQSRPLRFSSKIDFYLKHYQRSLLDGSHWIQLIQTQHYLILNFSPSLFWKQLNRKQRERSPSQEQTFCPYAYLACHQLRTWLFLLCYEESGVSLLRRYRLLHLRLIEWTMPHISSVTLVLGEDPCQKV